MSKTLVGIGKMIGVRAARPINTIDRNTFGTSPLRKPKIRETANRRPQITQNMVMGVFSHVINSKIGEFSMSQVPVGISDVKRRVERMEAVL
jgi:hypothetical protein